MIGLLCLLAGIVLGRAFFPLEVSKPFILEEEKRVEVPVERIVEKRVEVPVEVIKYLDRMVPVEKIVYPDRAPSVFARRCHLLGVISPLACLNVRSVG